MAYGSPKQKAYFKAKALEWGLFPPCPEAVDLTKYGDIFDLEALKATHKARLARAAAGLKAIKLRRKIRKMVKGQDARARAAGFKSHADREAKGWTPVSNLRAYKARKKAKKRNAVGNVSTIKDAYKRSEKPEQFKRMGEDEDNARARGGMF